jgi:hypothetical protein
MVTDTGHLTPITADSDGDLETREAILSTDIFRTHHGKQDMPIPYDLCLCGADAQASDRNSPLVACSSMVRLIISCVQISSELTILGLHKTQFPLRLHQRALEDYTRDSHPQEISLGMRGL